MNLCLLLMCMPGCVRREGRNQDCRWPGEPAAGHAVTAYHLSRDAEFAEELAIRYADTHHGLRSRHFESLEIYVQSRNRCLGTMFSEIGKTHGVAPAKVFEALGRNRTELDLAVNLPFFLLYTLAGYLVVRRIWSRYHSDGWIVAAALIAVCSLVFGVGGVLLGEMWSATIESIRIDSGHLSYRTERLPWIRYQRELFCVNVVLFWIVAGVVFRSALKKGPDSTG
jgi:hypothetical protein